MAAQEVLFQRSVKNLQDQWPSAELAASKWGTLKVFCDTDENEAEGTQTISNTRLILEIPLSSNAFPHEVLLERTQGNSLVLSLGDITQPEGLLLMRVAIELMESAQHPANVWLRYSGDVDLTPYGFIAPTEKDEIPQSQVKGDKWAVFHRKSEMNRVHPVLAQLEPGHPGLDTWRKLIQHKSLLQLNEGSFLFTKDVLEVLPQSQAAEQKAEL
jgi:hypothetical protein